MLSSKIIPLRLLNQQLARPRFTNAHDLIAWMGAIQAQDYAMARWAIALRVPGLTDSAVEAAFNRGDILRTHLLRPTWHFVAPEDIRWMSALAAPQINSRNAYMHRQVGLDEKTFTRSNTVLEKSLAGGRHLTRKELQEHLRRGKIIAEGHRLSYLMMRAETEGIICSGPRQGKQFTYALLEEKVKPTTAISRETALIRLAEKYFRSRGPATVHDFANWSGLNLRDSRHAAASLTSEFHREEFSGKTYLSASPFPRFSGIRPTFLMPEYDEYGMSYKNLGTMWAMQTPEKNRSAEGGRRRLCLIVEGEFAGWWQKEPKGKRAVVDPKLLRSLTPSRRKAVEEAVEKYHAFVAPAADGNHGMASIG